MPTLLELASWEDQIGLCRSLGLDLIEINLNMPPYTGRRLFDLDLPRDLSYSLHLPEEANPWDFNESIRSAYLSYLEKVIDFALAKGILVLNMHMNGGIYFSLPGRKVYLFDRYKEDYFRANREFADRVSKRVAGTNTKICLENTGIYNLPFIREAVAELLTYPGFRLTWDIGHDYSSSGRDFGFMSAYQRDIAHLHLHDGKGGKNHLPLGSGEIEWRKSIAFASQAATAIIETKTGEALRKSIDILNI